MVDKILRDAAFNITKTQNMTDINTGYLNFFDKKTTPRIKGTKINSESKELTEELHKPIIRKVKKRKVYSPFRDNIWGAHLPDVQLLSKFNKGTCFCCVSIILLVNLPGLFL